MPFSIIEFLRLSGVTFDPYRANSSILLNHNYKRTLHKLHFYVRSVCVSVAEKKIRSVLCGQVQQKYMKNPVFGGL